VRILRRVEKEEGGEDRHLRVGFNSQENFRGVEQTLTPVRRPGTASDTDEGIAVSLLLNSEQQFSTSVKHVMRMRGSGERCLFERRWDWKHLPYSEVSIFLTQK
jgi:hypothetical protein